MKKDTWKKEIRKEKNKKKRRIKEIKGDHQKWIDF